MSDGATGTTTTGNGTGAAAGVATGGAGSGAGTAGEWTTGLSDELKGYVQNKGFKDVGTAMESYRNLEKLIGAPKERILKLPEKPDAPEWDDVYNRLGRPEKPDGYEITPVDGDEGSKQFIDWAKNSFHKLGLTKGQAEKFMGEWNEYVKTGVAKHQETMAQKAQQEESGLKKEWGAKYDENLKIAKRAASSFELDEATIDQLEQSLGFAGVMKLMNKLGTKVGEDKFVTGNNGGPNFSGAMTPEQARDRIAALRGDNDFVRRYSQGDVNAKTEMDRLHQFAYGS